MPPRIKILPTDEMLRTLQRAGHYVTNDFRTFQESCSCRITPSGVTVDFIKLYRLYTVDNLIVELSKTKHRLSAPNEGLALAIHKLNGNIGDISEPIMIIDGSFFMDGVQQCLCLQMWNATTRITKSALSHALRPGNFILTTAIDN
ncbi:MAG: hypothetical protein P1P90_05520 [Patescibacteria group bacterium]|nr:hypothetical protein [Patescibacteria group bacterium]